MALHRPRADRGRGEPSRSCSPSQGSTRPALRQCRRRRAIGRFGRHPDRHDDADRGDQPTSDCTDIRRSDRLVARQAQRRDPHRRPMWSSDSTASCWREPRLGRVRSDDPGRRDRPGRRRPRSAHTGGRAAVRGVRHLDPRLARRRRDRPGHHLGVPPHQRLEVETAGNHRRRRPNPWIRHRRIRPNRHGHRRVRDHDRRPTPTPHLGRPRLHQRPRRGETIEWDLT